MDPNIARIKDYNIKYLERINNKTKKFNGPLPSIVEFNLHGSCSRSCAFCPRVDAKKFPNLNEEFSLKLFEKIIHELKELDYEGRIGWSGYSEPLMHSDINNLIKITKKNLPKCTLDIVSNGDFLDQNIISNLFKNGLDHLRVSIYTNQKTTDKFKKIRENLKISPEFYFIRERNKGKKNEFGLQLNNRGGAVDLKKIGIKKDKNFPLKKKCNFPLFKIFIDYTGEYQICSNDWNKKKIIGNAFKQTITEVWYGEEFMKIRKNLMDKNRNMDPCKTCDVEGDLNGNEFYDEWKKINI